MPRAVLDPNVLISAFITPRGVSAELLTEFLNGAFEMIVSQLLIEELEGVLRREKFRRYATLREVGAYVALVRSTAVSLDDPAPAGEQLSTDPGDEYLIALARTARVDALVSGDAHLLRLGSRIPVRSPREFLDSIRSRR